MGPPRQPPQPEPLALAQAQDVLRYWLSALRLEEALAARPRARKLRQRTDPGGAAPRIDAPTPGQEYFKQPLDAAASEMICAGRELARPLDGELCGYFEDHLYRCYRRGDEDEDGGHLLCFPVVHLPRGELAGLLRMRLCLSFHKPDGKPFDIPSRARRRRAPLPVAPVSATLSAAAREPDDWPFFLDTRLLHRQLGFDADAIDRLFDALRSCETLTATRMLELVTRALERELEHTSQGSGEGDRPSDLIGRLTFATRALVGEHGGRARAFPMAIGMSGQQAKTTWHLQQEITQLLRRREPKATQAGPLSSYLTGKPQPGGRGLQRALAHGPALTTNQRTAAELVWGSRLAAVQGPPGTGKTTLIRHLCGEFLVRQVENLAANDELGEGPLLVTSSNNRAVDNALEPLMGEPGAGPQGALPLALRAGSRQVCERVTGPQLRHAAHFLEAATARPRSQREEALSHAQHRFGACKDRVGMALAGRARAFERERAQRELEEALHGLERDGLAQDRTAAEASLTRPASDTLAALAKLEARLIELSDLCDLPASLPALQAIARHFARTQAAHLPACEDGLRVAGLAPDLCLPPDLPATSEPAALMEAWQVAAEEALNGLASVTEALRRAEQAERRQRERERLLAQLAALGGAPEAPEVNLDEGDQRALFEAAVSLRQAWAAARAERLLPVVSAAVACVAEHRSLKPLMREDREAFASLQRLFGVWGCTALSLGNAFTSKLASVPQVIIDEAGQCHPAHAVSALLRAKRALVIGDVHQLAPVIELTPDDERRLFERLQTDVTPERFAPYRIHQESAASVQALADRAVEQRLSLTDHFRCQPDIIALCDALCGYGLQVHTAPAHRADTAPFLAAPVGWIETRGEQERLGGSWFNSAELAVVAQVLEGLLSGGMGPEDIAVITPYRGQLERLRRLLLQRGIPLEASLELTDLDDPAPATAGLALGTVHRFQGGERSVVLFSSVVSRRASLPFLNHRQNLLNVAISRARHHLIAIGQRDLLAQGTVTGVLARAGKPLVLPGREPGPRAT